MFARLLNGVWLGLAAVVLAVLVAVACQIVWGPLYGSYDWRYSTIAILLLEVMAAFGLMELVRPPNPYQRLDARYDLLDLVPSDRLMSSDSFLLWNTVPPIAAIVILVVSIVSP